MGICYIVELERGVYLADGDGDPPITLDVRHARIFNTYSSAFSGLVYARSFRTFEDASVKMMTADNVRDEREVMSDNRAEFEHWASDQGQWERAVERRGDAYVLASTNLYWRAWKARGESQEMVKLRDALQAAINNCSR